MTVTRANILAFNNLKILLRKSTNWVLDSAENVSSFFMRVMVPAIHCSRSRTGSNFGWELISQIAVYNPQERRHMIMRIVLVASVFLLVSGSSAFACSCLHSSGCPGLGGPAYPVFIGTVIRVTDLAPTGNFSFLNSRKVRIRVDESFGGLPPDASEIDVLTGIGGGDCGIPFKPGETYLVQASVSDDGVPRAGICSATRRIDMAGMAIRILRGQRDGQSLPSLAGQIAQLDRNFDGVLGTAAPKPMANALVRVKSDGGSYETRADMAGLYAFYGLPKGRYEFAPDLPQGTTLSWYIGSDRPPADFKLTGTGCEARNIEVFSSGSIQGRVLDSSNNLLSHALVYIVPTATKVLPKERRLYWVSQGKEGHFKFVHIPPGEYLILVNPEDSQTAEFPYPRTFHPGVHDRSAASVITVRAGEEIKDADIQLQRQFTPRHVNVRVTWADGDPVKDFVFIVAKGTSNPEMESDASTHEDAMVGDLKILPNEPYEVQAELTCTYQDERRLGPGATLKSSKVYITAGDGLTDLTLAIPATSCPAVPGRMLVNLR